MKTKFIKLLGLIFFAIAIVLLLLKYMPERFLTSSWGRDSITAAAISIVVLIILLYSYMNSHSLKNTINQLLVWVSIMLILITVYAFRFELQDIAQHITQRVIAVVMPSQAWNNKAGELMIARSSDGHFYVNAKVNNQVIRFMVDTGASDVALTKKDALKLNFDLTKLKYTRIYNTANGVSNAAPVILKQIQIGPLIFDNIKGHVGQGALDTSLLGMSVIQLFKSFRIDKDLLVLNY